MIREIAERWAIKFAHLSAWFLPVAVYIVAHGYAQTHPLLLH